MIPAGTPCRAQRSPCGSVIALSFDDGSLIELDGSWWYLEGLEPQQERWALPGIRELQAQEDQVFIDSIEQSLAAIQKKPEE